MEDVVTLGTTIFVYVVLCVLVANRAVFYRRSRGAWFALAFGFTPLVAYVFLLVADVPHRAIVEAERRERVRRRYPGRTDDEIEQISRYENVCPHCGAIINTATGEGVLQTENEPWALLCSRCQTRLPESFF